MKSGWRSTVPDKITLAYVKRQLALGYTHAVVCERASGDADAVSLHKNYESARKALHQNKRANAVWLLEDVRDHVTR
jgi:hypothetical protein